MALMKSVARNILISDFAGNIIRFFTSTVRLYRLQFTVSSELIKGKIVSLIFFQKYEKEEVEMIRKYLRSDLPIIDLGSSLGIVATTAAAQSNQSIVCVEANEALMPLIEENLLSNGVTEDRYILVNAAITDSSNNGKSLFFETRGSNELGRLCTADTPNAIRVETITLNTVVSTLRDTDYVLISDIEGAEAAYLFSDTECLKACRQLFIELHPVTWNGAQLSIDDLVSRIQLLGFELVEQRGANFYFTQDAA